MSGCGYAKIPDDHWTDDVSRKIRGDLAAVAVRDYLRTCKYREPIGVFYLPLPFVAHELGIPADVVDGALTILIGAGFCDYDSPTETILIFGMAGVEIGPLADGDFKRWKWIQAMYASIACKRFAEAIHDRY